MTRELEAAALETVWAVCPYLRGNDCLKCPRTETVHGHEGCVRACFALAEEAVNIAQTGNAWRKTDAPDLLKELTRQCDNMAFVLNRVDLHGFHEKFETELAEARAAISKAEGRKT